MSESKTVMAKKLANVQKALMGKEFEEISLYTLLPIIFEECCKENLTFWFNFIEDSCVLNLRDTRFDNYELNIRQNMGILREMGVELSSIKLQVLLNAFLIVPKEIQIKDVASSENKNNTGKETVKEDNKSIMESDLVPPTPIRIAIEECEKNNEPINRKNLESKLNLKQMNQDKRRQCIAFLRSMEE